MSKTGENEPKMVKNDPKIAKSERLFKTGRRECKRVSSLVIFVPKTGENDRKMVKKRIKLGTGSSGRRWWSRLRLRPGVDTNVLHQSTEYRSHANDLANVFALTFPVTYCHELKSTPI